MRGQYVNNPTDDLYIGISNGVIKEVLREAKIISEIGLDKGIRKAYTRNHISKSNKAVNHD